MKFIFFTSFLLFCSIQVIGQNLKVNQAEYYYKAYRFSEATPIYKELITKDDLKIDLNEVVFRHAFDAADKSRDYSFANEVMGKIATSKFYTVEDAYNYFQLSLMTKNYAKAKEIAASDIVINATSPKKDLLAKYENGSVWDNYKKDTVKYKIKEVEYNSGKGDFNAIYHPKGIVFSSARDEASKDWSYDNSNFLNLYLYSFESKKVKAISFLKSKRHDGTAYYDSINKLWYYARNLAHNPDKFSKTGIFIYDEKTEVEKPFAYNSENYFVAQPYLSEDGSTLWFSSDMNGGFGKADIWYSKKTDSTWSKPVNAGELINTSQNEMFPFTQKNKLYFSTNGHPGLGGLDIYTATLTDGIVTKIKNAGANLNSNGDDFSIVIEKTGKKGYFSSNRTDFIDRIYEVSIKDLDFIYKANLVVDIKGDEDLQKVPVVIKENGQVVDTLYADKDGNIQFTGKENSNYTIEPISDLFFPIADAYTTIGKTESDTTFRKLELKSKYVRVNTIVEEFKTKKPLPNSTVFIYDPITKTEQKYISDDKGQISVVLERNKTFNVHATHKGHFDNDIDVATVTTSNVINNKIDLKLIVKGSTFQIENIFYDYGKATLRPESMVELDKLAEFLIENPSIIVELSAHTDSRGSDAKNLILSQKRAQSCVDYLITKGVNKTTIVAKGYGESKLINKCKNDVKCTEDEHQKNRRTEIKILGVK